MAVLHILGHLISFWCALQIIRQYLTESLVNETGFQMFGGRLGKCNETSFGPSTVGFRFGT